MELGKSIKSIPLDRYGQSNSRTCSRICDVNGCQQSCRDGKPYCPDHVDHNPYVQGILQVLVACEEEAELVKRKGAAKVDPEGLTSKELILHLNLHGPRTAERLAREMNLEAAVLAGYLKSLSKRGLIVFGATGRGSTVVKLVSDHLPEGIGG